jgi:hypothetical protein
VVTDVVAEHVGEDVSLPVKDAVAGGEGEAEGEGLGDGVGGNKLYMRMTMSNVFTNSMKGPEALLPSRVAGITQLMSSPQHRSVPSMTLNRSRTAKKHWDGASLTV